MHNVNQYFDISEGDLIAGNLDIGRTAGGYQLFYSSDQLRTPAGKEIVHPSERFTRAVLTDMQLRITTGVPGISFASLLVLKLDFLDEGLDPFLESLDELTSSDPFIMIKTREAPVSHSLSPDEPLFNFAFNLLSGLILTINKYTARLMAEIPLDESAMHPVIDLVRSRYQELDPWRKAILQTLSRRHGSGVTLPMGLVSGIINPAEYSRGMVALGMVGAEKYPELMQEASEVHSFMDFLEEFSEGNQHLEQFIDKGEGEEIEFKSTLRWDLRAGKTNQAVERAVLKTISAFLNSRGGTLLIGVRDDGSVEGIESDRFPNEDKFLLHLWTLIRSCLGRDFSPYIRTTLEKREEKTICMVMCRPSVRPVFLRQPGFEEEMYIRIGPSSNALNISEALQYIRERFPENH